MGMQSKAWSSAELKKKTIKDVNDAIEDGEIEVGGGTEVVANPEGATASDDLTTLQVGEAVYSVPNYWTYDSTNERVFTKLGGSLQWYFYDSKGVTGLSFGIKNGVYTYAFLQYANNEKILAVDKIQDYNFSFGSVGQVLGKNVNNKLAWITPSGGTQLYQHYFVSGDDVFFIITTNSTPMTYDDVIYNCWKYNGRIISIIYQNDNTNHIHVCLTDDNGISDGGNGLKSIAYIHNGAIVVKALPTTGSDTVTPL